jgi:endonuclease/exonuclease/phosphatase family metal-dependent hydrolase
MPTTRNEAAAYRLSLAGPYAWAGYDTPSGTGLRLATYNVKSVTSSAGYPGYTWRDRRRAVAASIARSGAAVVATQELNMTDAGLGTGARQWEDLRDLLAQPGYGGYTIANTVTRETTGGDTNVAVGTHLFYRSGVVTREAGGFVSPRRSLNLAWPSGLTDRYFSWARFRVNATGARFYAVSVHLPVDSGPTSYATLRNEEIAAIDRYVSGMAGNLPVVLLGDFNSSMPRTTNGPDTVLRGRGYDDASATPNRAGLHYPTVNTSSQMDNLGVPGFPTRPYTYWHPAVRVDYILAKHAAGSWRYGNQLVLTDGRFDRTYQGSDHNLQWAEVGIPRG